MKRKSLLVICMAFIIAVLAAGCGSSDDDSEKNKSDKSSKAEISEELDEDKDDEDAEDKNDEDEDADDEDDAPVSDSDFELPVANLIKSMQTGKSEYMMNSMPSYIRENETDESMQEAIGIIDEALKAANDGFVLEYGENFKLSYRIEDKTAFDEDDIKSMEEDVKDEYNVNVTISEGYELEVGIHIDGANEDGEENVFDDTTSLKVVKIDGEWFLYDFGV